MLRPQRNLAIESLNKSFARFLLHLLAIAECRANVPPVIVFAHSQGAAIVTRALELLEPHQRLKLRIFTFGGLSFVPPGLAHPDSHNYASSRDLIPKFCTYDESYVASLKDAIAKGAITEGAMIRELVDRDVIVHLDTTDPGVVRDYEVLRSQYWQNVMRSVSNVTFIPSKAILEHFFSISTYMSVVGEIVSRYKCMQAPLAVSV